MLPVVESPFYLIVMFVVIAIVMIAFTTSFQSGEQEKEDVVDNAQLPFVNTIGNIVRVTQDPEAEVACSQGIEQTLYTVDLKSAKVKFLERGMDQNVYVSIYYKGARAANKNIQPLKPEIEQLLSSEAKGEVKFVNMISEEPPPILRNDAAEYPGQIQPLQTLFLNNHMITLQSLENKFLYSTGPLDALRGGRCVATIRFQCAQDDISLMKLYLEDDKISCQDQENPEICQKYINPCKVVAKIELQDYADATKSCGERKPVFRVLADKAGVWEIGDPLWIIFWRNEPQYQDCWKKERFDPDNGDRCDLAYLGAQKISVPPSSYKTGCA
ncbi:MAG: hypothetical protein HY513_05625 [Candidatus Aenigmarchaeota archaeon]|nr:hypothetical protein [Candidatus Aenigmarchaeota archaeon]